MPTETVHVYQKTLVGIQFIPTGPTFVTLCLFQVEWWFYRRLGDHPRLTAQTSHLYGPFPYYVQSLSHLFLTRSEVV